MYIKHLPFSSSYRVSKNIAIVGRLLVLALSISITTILDSQLLHIHAVAAIDVDDPAAGPDSSPEVDKHGQGQVQECDATRSTSSTDDTTAAHPPPPQVILNGQLLEVNVENFVKKYGSYGSYNNNYINGGEHDEDYEYYILNRDKHVLYIPNFLDDDTMIDGPNGLIRLCLDQNRFVRSPVRKNNNDSNNDSNRNDSNDGQASSTTIHDDHRTSESCTGIPVAMYRKNPKVQAMIYPNGGHTVVGTTGQDNNSNNDDDDGLPQHLRVIKQEMELHWDVATKATRFIYSDKADPSIIEPLQIVRYTHPNSQYKLHHDHGGFYNSNNKISSSSSSSSSSTGSVVDERPWTMLVFLNTPIEGGHTSFPKLGLEVMPRKGDAIVWSNVVRTGSGVDNDDDDEEVDPDMVHAGLPPTKGEKYALNVWFGPLPKKKEKKNEAQHDDDGDDDGGAGKLQRQGRWQ